MTSPSWPNVRSSAPELSYRARETDWPEMPTATSLLSDCTSRLLAWSTSAPENGVITVPWAPVKLPLSSVRPSSDSNRIGRRLVTARSGRERTNKRPRAVVVVLRNMGTPPEIEGVDRLEGQARRMSPSAGVLDTVFHSYNLM
jgi:hypothetical protein